MKSLLAKDVTAEFARYPALWIGSLLLVGIGLALNWGASLFPWAVLLLYPWIKHRNWLHLALALVMMCSAYAYAKATMPKPLEAAKAHGIGYFSPSEVRQEESPFGKQTAYIGMMRCFQSDSGEIASDLPCRIYFKSNKNRPLAHCHYLIEGTLSAKNHGGFVYKPDRMGWKAIEDSHSLAEWRFRCKEKAYNYLHHHFSGSRCLPLFSALTLGRVEERQLVSEFRNLGLSHILAISGFHFALGAGLLLLILRPIFPKKTSPLIALVLLSGYAFFLGESPSVLRAWAAISLFLVARLLGFRTNGLNALGVGLIAELIYNPLLVSHLGFQLSFLATAAILFLYSPCEKLIQKIFLPRSIEELKRMPFSGRHLYLLSSCLRKALALNTAVHAVVLPASLLHFHSFPMLSYLYNLFYPLLISLSMTALLITSAIDQLLPWIGGRLHQINRQFTEGVLEIVSYPPVAWSLPNPTEHLSPYFFSIWTLLLVLICLRFDKKGVMTL